MDSGIEVHIDAGIAFVRLSRAPRRNAMGLEFMQSLENTIDELAT